MTTSDVISDAWASLRAEAYTQSGRYERRIFAASPHSVFAGLERPSGLSRLHFNFIAAPLELPSLALRGMSVHSQRTSPNEIRVSLEQVSTAFEELFLNVASDLVTKVMATTSSEGALAALVRRLQHWQRFMENTGPHGLTLEQQTGLFGELTVLLKLVRIYDDQLSMVQAWRGPTCANQDFTYRGCAMEVKAAATNVLDVMTVANEFQLDDAGLESLYLCQLAFDARTDTGVTLPAIVAEIRSLLTDEADSEFCELLLQAGYSETHEQLYKTRGYIERRRAFYIVSTGFPRIIAPDLPAGISHVRYELNTNSCGEFRQPENEVLAKFLGTPV